MSTELKAGDTITAESLNGIAEGAYTFKSGEILTASKLNTISGKIDEQEEEIAELQAQVEELEAEIDAFPTIESKTITANGTYSEVGKAYSPVTVNVPSGAIRQEIMFTITNNYTDSIRILFISTSDTATENRNAIIYSDIAAGASGITNVRVVRGINMPSSFMYSIAKIINNVFSLIASYGTKIRNISISQTGNSDIALSIASSSLVINGLHEDNNNLIEIAFSISDN